MRSRLILELQRLVSGYNDAAMALVAAVGTTDACAFNQLKRDTVSKRLECDKSRDELERHLKTCDRCSTYQRSEKVRARTPIAPP